MDSKTIRSKFTQFFQAKSHQIVPSAPIVVKDDPSLMFTNAGMNQFKDYFLGNKKPAHTRVADSQKCLRVSGKHNDLEEVGVDTYHHTMFEMLGNWSFGDYFKKEAIEWAWELLTKEFKLPKEDLYATVFEGDKADGLQVDDEALAIWGKILPESRILYGDKTDNFWEMGDTGPCGPASEIHIDLRPPEEKQKVPGRDLVNEGHPLVVEIWNLVFIQFNRLASGQLEQLPARHIDTGMGFERLAMAIQGKSSNYDTDVFTPLISQIEQAAGVKYGEGENIDIAIRVVADHIRAIAFTIADGQLPSNNKAGYVIRRILRRAVRYGYTFLGFQEPFMKGLVPVVAEQFAGVFPELKEQEEFVARVIQEEEASFLKTLDTGLKRLDKIEDELMQSGSQTIDGKTAFELYDTFGFPLDLTALIAREKGLSIDQEGFEKEMQAQKARSKRAAEQEKEDWVTLQEVDAITFVGYDHLQASSQIVKYREVKEKKKKYYQLVLDVTPFYSESGGQIGDQGWLIGMQDDERIKVIDTQKENDLIVHITEALPKDINQAFRAQVDGERRYLIRNNHTATHLLHAALREVLGDHVQQKGSYVGPNLLRFDFSHFAKLTEGELAQVEHIVNKRIRQDIALDEKRNVPIADAKKMGATALFGEKYGDFVRVITFDPEYSVELCGGTHVPATGHLGLLKITTETSVAAGVRRIEAVTADEAETYVDEQIKLIEEVKQLLKSPKDVVQAVSGLLQEKNKLSKNLEALQMEQVAQVKKQLIDQAVDIQGVKVINAKVGLPNADALKKMCFELKNELAQVVVVLAVEADGKPMIGVSISDQLVNDKGLHAGNMVKALASEIKGGGGGQPFFATAGGKDLSGLDQVVEKANALINESLSA